MKHPNATQTLSNEYDKITRETNGEYSSSNSCRFNGMGMKETSRRDRGNEREEKKCK